MNHMCCVFQPTKLVMMSPAVLHLDVGCDLSEGNAELRQDRRRFAALEIRAGNIENREPKRLTCFRS